MPWQEQSAMSLRREFVAAVAGGEMPVTALCARYQISRKTGYKWLRRHGAAVEAAAELGAAPVDRAAWGAAALADRSRRPAVSPRQTDARVETAAVAVRAAHPAWGGRKIHHWLARHPEALPAGAVPPAPSTVTDILRRHGLLTAPPPPPTAWTRFEHAVPNDLWQMDFLGHRPLGTGGRVHPLTVVDDCSRFALVLAACPHEQRTLVQAHLRACFQRYGLPRAILTDNGPPWGTSGGRGGGGGGGITRLEAWLLRLGVALWHGAPYHPQTQGKVERLHRTIAAEAFGSRPFATLAAAQAALDAFRASYNHDRPHEHLGHAVPAERYVPSPRAAPTVLPEPVYAPDDEVRRVRAQGAVSYANRSHFVSLGLVGEVVAVRPTQADGVLAVYFCSRQVAEIDLHTPAEA